MAMTIWRTRTKRDVQIVITVIEIAACPARQQEQLCQRALASRNLLAVGTLNNPHDKGLSLSSPQEFGIGV